MHARGDSIRLATRGSDLARRQAASVRDALADRRTEVELVEVETTGDELRDELIHRLGTTGAFVRSLDERVMEGDCDAAVHSMKDVPTESPETLVVAGVPQRATPGDLLVTPDGATLEALPEGATVGTSSLRRRAQLLAERPDLEIAGLRGNVDTRVEKLLAPHLQAEHERRLAAAEGDEGDGEGDVDGDADDDTNADSADGSNDDSNADSNADDAGEGDTDGEDDGADFDRTVEAWFDDLHEIERRALGREVDVEYDGIVLAAAGLERLGLDYHVPTQRLPTDTFVPAPGQGALAVTAADGDLAERLKDVLDHQRSRVECTVERTILAELGGGCVAPMGVHAVLQGDVVHAIVRVLSRDGTEEVAASRDLPVQHHDDAAAAFAADLADRGAADLIQRAKREAGGDATEDGPDADAATAQESIDEEEGSSGVEGSES